MLPGVVDVTAITGQRVIGPLTSWQTPDGPYIVEHLAGVSPTGDVLVYFWSPRHDWQAVNVSNITQQQTVGPLTSWQTPADLMNIEHLAGINANNDLYIFFWSPQQDWQAVNLSLLTGQQVASPLASWQVPNGLNTIEHLAGVSPGGDVLVFFWSMGGIYTVRVQAVRVSDDDGARPADIVPEQVRQWVSKANEVYAVAAIQLQFNSAPGSSDWSTVNSTILNNMTGDQDQNWNQEKDTGNSVAAQHPAKITAFSPTGVSFSSTDYNFVTMTGFTETSVCGHQNIGLFAHELGHYMGLSHTFAREFGSVQEAESFFTVNGNNPAVFDGDGLSDTPPDPYVNVSQVQCLATTTNLSLNGTQFILPRNNIMSYYDDPAKTITPQQVQIVRQALEARVQRGLILGKP